MAICPKDGCVLNDDRDDRTLKKTVAREITTTSSEVTLNGGLARESPTKSSNSGLGFLIFFVICPDGGFSTCSHTKKNDSRV